MLRKGVGVTPIKERVMENGIFSMVDWINTGGISIHMESYTRNILKD